MSKIALSSMLLVVHSFVSFPGFVSAQEVADLKPELVEKWNNVNSLKTDFAVKSNTEVGTSKGESQTTGTLEWLKIENGLAYRIHEVTTSVIRTSDSTISSRFESLSIYDGRKYHLWIKHSGDSDYSAIETDGDAPVGRHAYLLVGGESLFNELSDEAEVFFRGTDSVDGLPTYVFESLEDELVTIGGGLPVEKYVVQVSKDSGIPIQSALLDTGGNTIYSLSYSNLKINIALDPASFSNPDSWEVIPKIQK